MAKIKKVVLAYSGGLDTSVILKWLMVEHGYEVITVTADLGQEDDLDGVEPKARKTGASKVYIEDLRAEFARDYIYPMMRAGAIYEGRYLMGTSIARPLIAKRLVEIARAEGAQAIAHGATGKVRFELAINALAPDLTVIAPWREWDLMSRTALTEFAERHGIEVNASNKHYSMDRNMLHCSFEGGELEDPWEEPGPESYIMAVPVEKAPDEPEYITIDFEKGDAVALNDRRLIPMEMVMELNRIAGKHGIGRLDMVENRFVGMKSRGVYETPGGTVLHVAHQDLEGICLDREALAVRDTIMPRYAAGYFAAYVGQILIIKTGKGEGFLMKIPVDAWCATSFFFRVMYSCRKVIFPSFISSSTNATRSSRSPTVSTSAIYSIGQCIWQASTKRSSRASSGVLGAYRTFQSSSRCR